MFYFDLNILIILISVIITVLMISIFRQKAILAYILIYLFYPNLTTRFSIFEVAAYTFVELAGIILLFTLALNKRSALENTTQMSPKVLHKYQISEIQFFVFLCITFVFQFAITNWFVLKGVVSIPNNTIFMNNVSEISKLIFIFACSRLIYKKSQIVEIAKAVALFTILLLVEFLFVGMIPSLSSLSFTKLGIFRSLFINDPVAVSMIGAFGAIFSLYLWKIKRNTIWLFTFLSSTILTSVFLSRSTMTAYLISVICFYLVGYFKAFSFLKKNLIILSLVMIYGFGALGITTILSSSAVTNLFPPVLVLANDNRGKLLKISGFLSSDSTLMRFGIQMRAIEVIQDFFPFGVGYNNLRYYMGGPTTREFKSGATIVNQGYDRVAERTAPTEAHNRFVEYVASYGFLGIVSIFLCIIIFSQNIRLSYLNEKNDTSQRALLTSMLVLIIIHYTFLSYPDMSIFFVLTLHLSYLSKWRPLNNE